MLYLVDVDGRLQVSLVGASWPAGPTGSILVLKFSYSYIYILCIRIIHSKLCSKFSISNLYLYSRTEWILYTQISSCNYVKEQHFFFNLNQKIVKLKNYWLVTCIQLSPCMHACIISILHNYIYRFFFRFITEL
jgi:hypothetical protein